MSRSVPGTSPGPNPAVTSLAPSGSRSCQTASREQPGLVVLAWGRCPCSPPPPALAAAAGAAQPRPQPGATRRWHGDTTKPSSPVPSRALQGSCTHPWGRGGGPGEGRGDGRGKLRHGAGAWRAQSGSSPGPRVVKAAGYQRASVTLGASGFQERKEVWGHPAPLPPFSSKQPAPADNRAAPVPRRNSGPPAARAAPKMRDFFPRFLCSEERPRCRGGGGPGYVRGARRHRAAEG